MKRQGVLVVLLTAAATMAFTVMLLAPSSVDAVDAPKIKAIITSPQLESSGALFTVKADKAEYEAGDRPVVGLKASNPTDKPVEATIWINILASTVRSDLSRMPSVPQVLWSHPQVVSLEPGEVKTLSIPSDTALPAGRNVMFTMTDHEQKQIVLAAGAAVIPSKGNAQPPSVTKTPAIP